MNLPENRIYPGIGHQVERLFERGSLTGLTEGQLLERFASEGDESAFELLVERHGSMVLGVCRRFLSDPNDADDAFQATFLVLARKAACLRRKDLVKSWLYGVACRVALRARSASARRMSRTALRGDVSGLDAAEVSGLPFHAVARAEEALLLHEELNRLPGKYREPIALCCLEGLTHEEAAARLGWPIGSVKGRLSRAREMLRRRLSRRGVALSAAALAVHLSAARLGASVPAALVQRTVCGAVVLAGRGTLPLAAASAISLSVNSLTEGVIRAMVLAQVRLLLVPALLVVGVLSTGASVIAYQATGKKAAEGRETRPGPTQAHAPEAARPGAAATAAEPGPVSEVMLARKIVAAMEKQAAAGTFRDPEDFRTWSLRLLEADKRELPVNAPPTAGLEGHMERMTRMSGLAQGFVERGQLSAADGDRWRFFAMEAERMLRDATKRTPVSGMMSSMMGGGMNRMGMGGAAMRGMAMDPRMEMPVGMVPGLPAGTGANAAASMPPPARTPPGPKPGTPQPQPQPQPQPMPMPEAPLAGGGYGGGGIGGGGDDSQEREGRDRVSIAGMAAELAAVDTNARNQEISRALEQPSTLAFPDETPLQDALNFIKTSCQEPGGKPLPLYVDPVGLAEADKTLTSPVTIDLHDVPLRFSLRLMLKQLGLAYCVRDGVLIISSVNGIKQELSEANAEYMANPNRPRAMGFGPGMQGGTGMM